MRGRLDIASKHEDLYLFKFILGNWITVVDILSDQDINILVKEKKLLPKDYHLKIKVHPKKGHKERELDIKGENGHDFRLILRQSILNPLDFSVILAFRPVNSNVIFRLRRYNGKSHEHTNMIEHSTFYDYHIHQATERYQQLGLREDAYAEPTDRFADFNEAISCLIEDCRFELPSGTQKSLFEGN